MLHALKEFLGGMKGELVGSIRGVTTTDFHKAKTHTFKNRVH